MDYIKELKKFRTDHGLDKAAMSRLFNVGWQTYHNWEARNSLPKSQIERAQEILDHCDESDVLKEALKHLKSMSPKGQEAALAAIEAIHNLEKQ